MTRRGWLLFGALGLAWGVPYLFIKIAVADLDPVVVTFGRTAVGALLLLPLAVRRRAFAGLRAHWMALLVYTGVEIIAPWLLLAHAETRLNSSTTGLMIAAVPIVAAVVVTVTGQDRLGVRRVAGLVIGLAGVAVLVGLDVRLDDLVAIGQLALVVVGYAVGPVIVSRRLAHLPSLGVVTVSLGIAAVAYAPFAVLARPTSYPLPAVGSVLVLGVVCTALAFLLMFALITEAGPARMTMITYMNPVVAVALGALVLGEPVTLGLLVGFPLIVLGSVLGTWRSRTEVAHAEAPLPLLAPDHSAPRS